MFYSLAIPGILQGRSVQIISTGVHVQRAQERASMEQTTESQEGGVASKTTAFDLTRLYEQFRRPIHSYVYRLLGNQEDADDVTQEVFVRACMSWDRLSERDHLSPWLYRIATNLCVDQLRRRKRISWWPLGQRRSGEDYGEEVSEDTLGLLSDTGGIPEVAEREHIRLALAGVPQEYAVVLALSAAQGIPYQEIATIVGISPNAAATRISRAKKMFAAQYQRLCGDRGKKQGGGI